MICEYLEKVYVTLQLMVCYKNDSHKGKLEECKTVTKCSEKLVVNNRI